MHTVHSYTLEQMYCAIIVPAECKIHILWINVLSAHHWVYDITVVNIDVVVREDT